MSLSVNVTTSPRHLQTSQFEMKQKMAYFNQVLKSAGFTLRYDELPNVINQEQALVSRDINKALRSHITYPNNSQEFMAGLKLLCDREIDFRKALSLTELKKLPSDEVLFNEQPMVPQDSLIRLVLSVECLQSHVIEMLLEEITTAAADHDNEDTSYLRLLLNPLRYLSHINDSKFLTTKLLDILEIATYTKQLEILNLIPEIIPDNEYEGTAKQLSKLLNENNELTAAIIDCLNSLNLTSDIREEIQSQILVILEASSSYAFFPILFEFLITDCDSKNLQGVLSITRSVLDTIMSLENANKEVEANKVLILNRLQAFARAKRSLCDAWINLIVGIRSHSEHKPIDFLILFMLHSIGSSRKSAIEGIIRKRIKNGIFKIFLLETLFQKYFVNQNFKDNLSSIIEIASNMIRFHSDGLLVEFSSTIFVLLFNHELIDYTQRQDILHNLILLFGRSDKKSVTPVLHVLILFLDNFERLQQYAVQLMGLLEKLDAVELKDVKSIFHILCSLTCSQRADNSVSGLKDEIHMIVRKQLSSCKKTIKHQGIVAAVIMAKTLVLTSEEQMDSEAEDSMTLDDLPQGPSQEAASLVLLANTCTLGSSDSVGLYYDQLAAMLIESAHNLNNHFVSWLYSLITNDFQNTFVTEATPDPIYDITMSMQYSLNSTEEIDSPISIRIAELTLKSQNYSANSILTLAPIFRLLRLLHFRQHNGELSTIDALLGCSVLMPDLKDIEIYDSYQLGQIADCIFHCINWFREIISAFVTQKNKKLRHKVMQRLADIVELEEILEKCLTRIPDHKFPVCYFDKNIQNTKQSSPTKSTKNVRPTKKQKVSDTIINGDETIASTSAAVTQQTKSTTAKKKIFKEVNLEKITVFREMDTDIILLIRYPMKLDSMNISLENMDTQKTTSSLNQVIFLLDDLVSKLTTLNKSKALVLPHTMKTNAVNLITDCVHFLPNINKHLDTVILGLDDVLQENNSDMEEMYTGTNGKLKIAFNLILKTYASIFAWPGFQHTKYSGLLKDCLKALKKDQESQLFSIKGLVNEFTLKLLGYVKYCLHLPAAISLVEIMQTLHVISPNPDLKKRISATSGKLLTKPWYNLRGELESGKSASLGIDFLIKSYLGGANVKTVCNLVGTLQNQVSELKLKEDHLPMLNSINKTNFYLFYRCLGVTLLECVRNEITALTNNQHLVLWRTTALTMQGLMTVVKNQETKTNLISYLKNSIGILKVFLASGIPILEIMLRSKTDQVVEIFKIMQTSTRFLHHLCCYSKFTKDSGLVAYVPQFRLLLESLLYRVKAALVANNCSAAFWMGTLRNRDLHGEDILSQSSLQTNESNEEEELPPDESEEEIVQNDITTEQGDGDSSGSDIF